LDGSGRRDDSIVSRDEPLRSRLSDRVTIRCAQAAGRRDDPISTRPGPGLAGPGRDDPFIC
jgi:hypothetical protein